MNLVVMPGDGIGPEITVCAVRVLGGTLGTREFTAALCEELSSRSSSLP